MKEITWVITDQQKNEYWKETVFPMEQVTDAGHVINIHPDLTAQEIHGFGGAFTEASAYNYSCLNDQTKEAVIESLFGESGLRYNMGRLTVHSCDFGLGNYTYVQEGDEDLSTFSLEHDRKWLFPMLRAAEAKAGKPLCFMASPWSPPAYMKTNHDMNHGGKLRPEYRDRWAAYLARFLQEYEKEGFPVSYLSVQNEPLAVQTWDSCIYTAEEERDFVRDHLGPTLEKEGLSRIKLLVWDHNKEELYHRVKLIYEDTEASRYVSGAAVHWYTGDHFEELRLVRQKYPDKEIIFSEGCVEYSRFSSEGGVWQGEMYAHDILGNLAGGASAFLDWNLLLDDKGGPNHAGNYCSAPLMCCPPKNRLHYSFSYYYIGHFSRYIKPGARLIGTSRYTDQLEAAAFLNPDGERVVIVLNKTENELPVTLRESPWGFCCRIPAHTISTFLYQDTGK